MCARYQEIWLKQKKAVLLVQQIALIQVIKFVRITSYFLKLKGGVFIEQQSKRLKLRSSKKIDGKN